MANRSSLVRFLRFWLPVYLYAGLVFAYSSQSRLPFTPTVLYADKLFHLVEYAILGYLLARAARNSLNLKLSRHFRIFAVFLSILYGLSDEFHQYFVPGREATALDLLADGLGASLGQMLFRG